MSRPCLLSLITIPTWSTWMVTYRSLTVWLVFAFWPWSGCLGRAKYLHFCSCSWSSSMFRTFFCRICWLNLKQSKSNIFLCFSRLHFGALWTKISHHSSIKVWESESLFQFLCYVLDGVHQLGATMLLLVVNCCFDCVEVDGIEELQFG